MLFVKYTIQILILFVLVFSMFPFCLPDVAKNPEPVGDMTILWVSKWVDYSNKYGFGFQLSNDSIGVLFNDTSKIILSPDGR